MNIKCPHCNKTIKNIRSLEKQEQEKRISWEIDKCISEFETSNRLYYGEYPSRNLSVKHLKSKGFTYRDIAKYFKITPQRAFQINNDIIVCKTCGAPIKGGNPSDHKLNCKRYKI